jgi:hypothetical protein
MIAPASRLASVGLVALALAACASSSSGTSATGASTSATSATSGSGGAGGAARAGGSGGAGASGGAGGTASGGAGGAGGAPVDPALDAACTPTFTLDLEDQGPGGQLFKDAVPDPEGFAQAVGRDVCRILYRHPDEVRAANHLTLILKDDPTAGWKSGDVGDITVMISTRHLQEVANAGGDVAREIAGILHHEMTHMYQNDDKAPGEGTYANLGNVVEGIADFVRFRAGFLPLHAQPTKTGAWDDEGYWKPAFFLLWIDDARPDFLYQLNQSMKAGDGVAWTPAAFESITGKSVDALWSDYAASACCKGKTQDCCK